MTEFIQKVRDAIIAAPLETSNFGEIPQENTLYIPPSHMKALRLDANVVVGGRGVGKSFWTAALKAPQILSRLATTTSELRNIEVHVGFGGSTQIDDYPTADVFTSLQSQQIAPYDIWRSVVLRWVARRSGTTIPCESWEMTVGWLKSNSEDAARLMQRPRDWTGLILFDALDRTSSDWRNMDEIVRGLLRTILWLKTFSNIHGKVFLREDQSERTVFNFPDASKLTATKAELTWARHDLHGLLWQRLINAQAEHGKCLRELCPHSKEGDIWVIPQEMKTESEMQRNTFEKLAGPWMGRDKRRGVPYTWAVGHLADGRGQTSPRSFLAAIQQAAEDSTRYPDYEYALHFESIKRGIQQASAIRVREIAEDYPWVPTILSALKGTNVPIEYAYVKNLWEETLPSFLRNESSSMLPPPHAERGWDGLRDDLQRLGVIEMKKDGRLDMPDLYRVGFGLGRKGGVKPRG